MANSGRPDLIPAIESVVRAGLASFSAAGRPSERYCVGGRSVEIVVAESERRLLDAIDHLRTGSDDEPAATAIEVRVAPHPAELTGLDIDGHLVFETDEVGLHLGNDGALALFDKTAGIGLWWFDRLPAAPWHLAAPLRQIFHWHAVGHRQALLHAAAVSVGGRAALITGPGGSGKSTTSLLCHRAGLDYLGDDYCIVEQRGEDVLVYGLYRTGKLNRASQQLVAGWEENHSVEVDQDKRAVFLPDALAGPVQASVILVARVESGMPPSRSPASRMQALAAAAPTSILQQRGEAAATLSSIAGAVRSLPAEHLTVSADPDAVVRQVEESIAVHG